MEHDDQIYLGHMLDTARKITAKVQGRRREHLDTDEDLRVVLTHWVQIIGEAAAQTSQPLRSRESAIPWRNIIGMRHRIVHDYMNIDVDTLWEVVTRDIPELTGQLEVIVPPEG